MAGRPPGAGASVRRAKQRGSVVCLHLPASRSASVDRPPGSEVMDLAVLRRRSQALTRRQCLNRPESRHIRRYPGQIPGTKSRRSSWRGRELRADHAEETQALGGFRPRCGGVDEEHLRLGLVDQDLALELYAADLWVQVGLALCAGAVGDV